jgi:hypothetical protein
LRHVPLRLLRWLRLGAKSHRKRYGTTLSIMARRGKIVGASPRALALRWGTYNGRLLAGIALLIAGAVNLQSANTYTLIFLLLGSLAHLVGWLVLPAAGGRRVGAMFPSLLGVFALLSGPQALPLLVVPLIFWLWVRQRPALSYVAVVPLLAVTIAFARVFREQTAMPFAFGISAVVLTGCAWAASALAAVASPSASASASASSVAPAASSTPINSDVGDVTTAPNGFGTPTVR